ncbi:hypothetical protein ACA910_018190 [Epithemia clementina (nom. ined.)]
MTTEKGMQSVSRSGKQQNGAMSGGKTFVNVGIEELRGNIYAYGVQGQAERYMRTTKAIAEHVGVTYEKELWALIKEKTEPTFNEPEESGDDASRAEMGKYKMLNKMKIDKEEKYRQDKAKVFQFIVGQCSTAMKNRIESLPEYTELEKNDDVVGLLQHMKDLVYTTDNVQYEVWTMQAVMSQTLTMKQEPKESLANFCKRFLAQVEVTEDVWGKMIPNKMKGKAKDEQEKARCKYLACVFLAGVDRAQYKSAMDDLNNDFLLGTVHYPDDVTGMMTLLSNRRCDGCRQHIDDLRDGSITETSFAQKANMRKIKSYNCGKPGHVASQCQEKSDNDDSDSGGSEQSNDTSTQSRKGRRGWSK